MLFALMREHSLTEKGWTWDFEERRSRFGACNYTPCLAQG